MRFSPLFTAIALAISMSLWPAQSQAAIFCVDTQVAINAALASAVTNAEPDEIRVIAGQLPITFTATTIANDASVPGSGAVGLRLLGGWNEGCTVRVKGQLSPIRGGGVLSNFGAFQINANTRAGQNSIYEISGFAFRNFRSSRLGSVVAAQTPSNFQGSYAIDNNVFEGNISTGQGSQGVLLVENIATTQGIMLVRSNAFINNRSDSAATAGIDTSAGLSVNVNQGGPVYVSNNTFAGNQIAINGGIGGVRVFLRTTQAQGSNVVLSNNIFWANQGTDVRVTDLTTLDRNNYTSILGAPLSATGTTSVDPQFANLAGNDARLNTGSPLLTSGISAPIGGLQVRDLDGNPRAGSIDLGAYNSSTAILFADGFED